MNPWLACAPSCLKAHETDCPRRGASGTRRGRDYYLEHATSRIAAAFAGEYEQGVIRLLEFPLVGAPRSRQQRALPLRHFPYSIIYRIVADTIIVSAVAHQRRRPGYWSGRR
ncbi:type II toxin-antitoxin system RelE/ParE family toxin [Propionivibrio sp.]|uniref:type II toxin-antitoxin system RelE/ParE family toxin n=1 Tax=Propionivibrio sp. TaxID=2212460 RepID=UPI00345D1319